MKVFKTTKLFIGGNFPRTESGRTSLIYKKDGSEYTRICLSSKKDFRNTVDCAKPAVKVWSSRTAFNRSQILYRMAEMLEGKRDEFSSLFKEVLGKSDKEAQEMVSTGRDAFVYYSGFCDKFSQVTGAVNNINGPYHNFSTPDSMGVVTYVESDTFDFERLCATIGSILVGGNSVIVILGSGCPSVLAPLAEVFATSDLPGGVVNLLSGSIKELYKTIGSHREVRSINYQYEDKEILAEIKELGVSNMKRIVTAKANCLGLQNIVDHVEFKSVWHPIGV